MANIQSGGVVDTSIDHKPCGRLHLNAAMTDLTNTLDTKVLLDGSSTSYGDGTEDTDNNNITPGIAGWYEIIGQVCFNASVANQEYEVSIKRDLGTRKIKHAHASKTGSFTVQIVCVLKLSATERIELWCRSRSGDNLTDVYTGTENTFLEVNMLRRVA